MKAEIPTKLDFLILNIEPNVNLLMSLYMYMMGCLI